MKLALSTIILAVVLSSFVHADDDRIQLPLSRPGERPVTLENLPLKRAKSILKEGKKKDLHLDAVYAVLESKLDEDEKRQILVDFFGEVKNIANFTDGGQDKRYRAFKLCAKKLKEPAKLFLELSKKPAYSLDLIDEANYVYLSEFMWSMEKLKEVPRELLDYILPACKKPTFVGARHFLVIARHANREYMKKAVSGLKAWSQDSQEIAIPFRLAPYRYRLPVFLALIDLYFSTGNGVFIKDCLLNDAYAYYRPYSVELPKYSETDPKDAAAMIKAIDELLGKKSILTSLKDARKRWKAKDFKKLLEIRKLLEKKADAYEKAKDSDKSKSDN